MKRRQFTQAMVVAPVLAALPRSGEAGAERIRREYDPRWLVKAPEGESGVTRVMTITPRGDPPKFAPCFQEQIEDWERRMTRWFRPVSGGPLYFDLLEADGQPWLIHPAWDGVEVCEGCGGSRFGQQQRPDGSWKAGVACPNCDGQGWTQFSESLGSPTTLYTPAGTIFRCRHWDIIDRAVYLRTNAYWRQKYLPKMVSGPASLAGGGMSPATSHYLMFQRVARSRLHRIEVRFEMKAVGGTL